MLLYLLYQTPRSAIAAPVRDRAGSARQRTHTNRSGSARYSAAELSWTDAPLSSCYEPAPGAPTRSEQRFESAIDQAAQAITEGRDAVQGLRSSTVETNDLAMAISALGEELAADGTIADSALFRMAVEGTPRNLHPILRDEVYRIAGETLRNAFRHAQARQIEVEIHYDARQFRLRVRDDGKGIDPEILGEDPRPGHFGLHGMRERAKIVGGQLDVWSELDSGTEVELSIPASRAYATPSTRRSWWSGKGSEIKS
jgi:signal transduction histidine kinase